ncbi:MAG: Pyrimidine 5'-nucleotidase YjjG [Flavobacterium sp. SCGC AAA160-P02]|nr:MAG: Pyrimidine 5'-nucleotidase YjjG [Flavobacterium sp. SCGC AAA160-P02]
MKITHIFFDLDHTLWDFEKNSALTFQEILSASNITINIDEFLQTYIPINLKYWKKYREDKIVKKDLKYIRLKETFDQLDYFVDDITIHHLSEEYIVNLPNHNHLFEGTFEILEYLQNKYQLHIITNGFEEVQNKKMQKSGIRKFFNEVITSEAVGVKKPNPKVFNYALNKVNTTASSSVMIGDNLEADILGAIKCGIKAIHFNSENIQAIPREITSINHLLEIKKYL